VWLFIRKKKGHMNPRRRSVSLAVAAGIMFVAFSASAQSLVTLGNPTPYGTIELLQAHSNNTVTTLATTSLDSSLKWTVIPKTGGHLQNDWLQISSQLNGECLARSGNSIVLATCSVTNTDQQWFVSSKTFMAGGITYNPLFVWDGGSGTLSLKNNTSPPYSMGTESFSTSVSATDRSVFWHQFATK